MEVRLAFAPRDGLACLREIRGLDESSVDGATTADAIRLLDGLLVETPWSSVRPGSASSLTAADRDRLLARIYIEAYGPRIESTVQCEACGEPFDLDFSLTRLLDVVGDAGPDGSAAAAAERAGGNGKPRPRPAMAEDGTFILGSGYRVRLPTGEDECAVSGLAPEQAERALLERCLVEIPAEADAGELDVALLESLAPVLDLELDAVCPGCERGQTVHFDIQHFLLSALSQERQQLLEEVHRLAMAYRWSFDEILQLSRRQRRQLVALVEAELHAGGWR